MVSESGLPPLKRLEYCSECRKTVYMILVEMDGKLYYVCAGDVMVRLEGCGHRFEVKRDSSNTHKPANFP